MPENVPTDRSGSIYHANETQRPVYPYQPPSSSAVYGYNCVEPGKRASPPSAQDRKDPPKAEKKVKSKKD